MFKIYSDKINIIKTSGKYQTHGMLEIFKPLMSNRSNHISNSEIKLKRLIQTIDIGDTIIFNSPDGISFNNDKNFNIITANFGFIGEIMIRKKRYSIQKVHMYVSNLVRLQKIKNLMR